MARNDERVRRDQAGVGPDPQYTGELVRLDELKDFRIASGDADVRGWDVCTVSGREIGEVEDMLIDRRRGEVVLLQVDLRDSDRSAEIPIRAVQIDREHRRVIVDSGDIGHYSAAENGERVVGTRPVVVEETIVRRRALETSDIPDEDLIQ